MDFFAGKDIEALVIINPDNPSGNYMEKAEILSLVEWCAARKIKLVVDESFADFADEEDNTLIKQATLEAHPNLYVMKSISKSYGVPGLRLGILASGDVDAIKAIKKDVSIWNINSFAEFYLQIAEKYKKQYVSGLARFRQERARFGKELAAIPGLRVVPSQANYFMIELLSASVVDITQRLLADYNILVKDLHKKLRGREYMRIAIRNRADNDRLVDALRKLLAT